MRSLIRSLIALSAIVAMTCIVGPVAGAAEDSANNYEILMHRGTAQLEAGHADQAVAIAERAIKSSPRRWEGYVLAGGALMNLKRYENAADRLSDAIARAPAGKQPALRELRRRALAEESPAGPAAAGSRPQATGTEATTQAEIVMWKSIESSVNPEDFQSYLNEYPHGAFAELARRHLTEALDRARQDEIAQLTWTDPATKLMWYRRVLDAVGVTRVERRGIDFSAAVAYCAGVRAAGYTGWRLPTIGEVETLYPGNARRIRAEVVNTTPGVLFAVGALQYDTLSLWTSTPGSKDTEATHFLLWTGLVELHPDTFTHYGWGTNAAAICVRSTK